MNLLLISCVVFGLALFGMSLGVIFSNRCIRGSCGGLSALDRKQGKVACDACPSRGRHADEVEDHPSSVG